MAEEQQQQNQAEVVENAVEDTGSYKTRLIIFISVVVLLVLLIAVGLFILFSGEEELKERERVLSKYEQQFLAASQQDISKVTSPIFVETEPYTVNLIGQRHYLKMTVVAVLQDPFAADFLKGRLPMLDDKVIMILKRQTIQGLRTRVGLELLKRKIYQEVNAIYSEGYFQLATNKDRTPVKEILINNLILN